VRKLLNTLYVSSQGSYIHKEGETIVVELEQQKLLQLPVHMIGGIVCFGNVLCSPFLLGFCAEHDIAISFLTEYGNFLASVRGPVSGNVLLRREQYRMADDAETTRKIAANIVAGKLANSRLVMSRAIRDHGERIDAASIRSSSASIDRLMDELPHAVDGDGVRGIEGMAAAEYFSVFNHFIVDQKKDFSFHDATGRPSRPRECALHRLPFSTMCARTNVGLDRQ